MGLLRDKEDRQYIYIKKSINIGRAIKAVLSGCTVEQIPSRNKLQLHLYNLIVKNTVSYEDETWKFNKNLASKHMSMEMDFFEEFEEILNFTKNRNNAIREKLIY